MATLYGKRPKWAKPLTREEWDHILKWVDPHPSRAQVEHTVQHAGRRNPIIRCHECFAIGHKLGMLKTEN